MKFLSFRQMRIRNKLLISYAAVISFIIIAGGTIQYWIVSRTIQMNIESELRNSTNILLSLVKTSVSVSIKNHLRAAAENNHDIVRHYYNRFRSGELSEAEAKKAAEVVLLSQTIGETGYIACVDSKGYLRIHPQKSLVGVDISENGFVQEMIRRKEGYIEYDWKNPGEPETRPKAMYMSYFEHWDWIITVSSYRKEFRKLFNINDFEESVSTLQFGETGYSFVTDTKGTVVIHPKIKGVNILNQDQLPREPFKKMLEMKTGKLVYSWQNPGESVSRKKLVIFNFIPEYDWIVASSSYLNEFYSPLDTVSNVIAITLIISLLLIFPVTFQLSASITKPLQALKDRISLEFGPQTFLLKESRPSDEIQLLMFYFNSFIARLERNSRNLQEEIKEREQAEAALRVSEEKYRSVMEATPDPIVVYDMTGKVTYMNPAFTRVFGWEPEDCVGKRMDHFVPKENWEETQAGIEKIISGQKVVGVETRRLTKSGQLTEVSIRGGVYRDVKGNPIGSVIAHRNITDLRRLERQVMDISDKERQKIGQDLHDDLGPHLIGIEGLIKVLENNLSGTGHEKAGLASQVSKLIKEAVEKTRQFARDLCPVYLVDHGLESALKELAENTRSIFGIQCRFYCRKPVPIADHTVSNHMFRITQEAVHNAIKHGKAKRVNISLRMDKKQIELSIKDNGRGIPKKIMSKGMGLRIMGFRAKMIDAILDIRKAPKSGTLVNIILQRHLLSKGLQTSRAN